MHPVSIEDHPYTPFLRKLTIYTSGGPFLDGYILVIIGVALIQLEPFLKLDSFWLGMVGASALMGLLAGGAFFGYVTDLMGRQLMYQIDLIAIIVLSIAQIFVTTAVELCVLRFLIGIAIGADYPIATALLAEFSPRKHRGLMLGLLICFWYCRAFRLLAAGIRPLRLAMDAGQFGYSCSNPGCWPVGDARITAVAGK